MYYYLNCYSWLKLQLKRETGPWGERIALRVCRKNYSRMLTFAYRGGYAWARTIYAECLFNNQETSRRMHRGAGMPGSLNQNSIASSALLERWGCCSFFPPLYDSSPGIYLPTGKRAMKCDNHLSLIVPWHDESVEYICCQVEFDIM